MVCFGPTSSVVASLTLVGVFFFPGYLILQDSSSPSETTTATPYPTSPAVGPAFCIECPDCEGFVFGLFSFESIHPLGLVLLALALCAGFLFGRFYERRGVVQGLPTQVRVRTNFDLPGKGRKRLGSIA